MQHHQLSGHKGEKEQCSAPRSLDAYEEDEFLHSEMWMDAAPVQGNACVASFKASHRTYAVCFLSQLVAPVQTVLASVAFPFGYANTLSLPA